MGLQTTTVARPPWPKPDAVSPVGTESTAANGVSHSVRESGATRNSYGAADRTDSRAATQADVTHETANTEASPSTRLNPASAVRALCGWADRTAVSLLVDLVGFSRLPDWLKDRVPVFRASNKEYEGMTDQLGMLHWEINSSRHARDIFIGRSDGDQSMVLLRSNVGAIRRAAARNVGEIKLVSEKRLDGEPDQLLYFSGPNSTSLQGDRLTSADYQVIARRAATNRNSTC